MSPLPQRAPRESLDAMMRRRTAAAVAALSAPAPLAIAGPTGATGPQGIPGATGPTGAAAPLNPIGSIVLTEGAASPAAALGYGTWEEQVGLVVGVHAWKRTA